MPSSWHSHRAGLGRRGGCDFSLWQRAVDYMGSQAGSRSTRHRTPGILLAGARKQCEAPPSFLPELRSLTPELATPPSPGVTRTSLFQEVLDGYLSTGPQWPGFWI